jgi:hypothetical protein
MTTRLSLTATPGRPYAAFVAKATAVITWTNIIIQGVEGISGENVYIVGKYRET